MPKMIALSGQKPSLPIVVIQIISGVQSSALLFAMVMLGAWFAEKVNLGTPLLSAYLKGNLDSENLKNIQTASLIGGVIGGMILDGVVTA